DERLWQFDAREAAIAEQDLEPLLGADAQMMPAIAADMEIGFELAVKQHLLAAGTLRPQIVQNRFFGDDRPDLWQDEVAQPIHRRLVAGRRSLVEPPSPAGAGKGSPSVMRPGAPGSSCCAAPGRVDCRCACRLRAGSRR